MGFCNEELVAMLEEKGVVIPTHMWASATAVSLTRGKADGCHTHSHVGFCNNLVERPVTRKQVVIPTHMWASATPLKMGI